VGTKKEKKEKKKEKTHFTHIPECFPAKFATDVCDWLWTMTALWSSGQTVVIITIFVHFSIFSWISGTTDNSLLALVTLLCSSVGVSIQAWKNRFILFYFVKQWFCHLIYAQRAEVGDHFSGDTTKEKEERKREERERKWEGGRGEGQKNKLCNNSLFFFFLTSLFYLMLIYILHEFGFLLVFWRTFR
jgi:hypothetical protein